MGTQIPLSLCSVLGGRLDFILPVSGIRLLVVGVDIVVFGLFALLDVIPFIGEIALLVVGVDIVVLGLFALLDVILFISGIALLVIGVDIVVLGLFAGSKLSPSCRKKGLISASPQTWVGVSSKEWTYRCCWQEPGPLHQWLRGTQGRLLRGIAF